MPIRREQIRTIADLERPPQLRADVREGTNSVGRTPVPGRVRRGEQVVVVVAHPIGAHAKADAHPRRRREVGLDVGRDGRERDVVLVDTGARRVAAEDRAAARQPGCARLRPDDVLDAGAGTDVDVHARQQRGPHRGEVTLPLREQPHRGVVGRVDRRVEGERPVRQQFHAVVAEVRHDAPGRPRAGAAVIERRAVGADRTERHRRQVSARYRQVVDFRQGRAPGGLLLDAVQRHQRFHQRSGPRPIPADRPALPVVGRGISPSLRLRQVQRVAKTVDPARPVAASEEAPEPGFARFERRVEPRPLERRPREHVHHAADRVAAVQRRSRPARDLDAIGRGQVDLVERVVIEEAGRSSRDPVLEEQVDRVGRQRLADRGLMSFPAGDVHPHPGHGSHHLARMRRPRLGEELARDDTDTRRRLPLQACAARVGDRDRFGEPDLEPQHRPHHGARPHHDDHPPLSEPVVRARRHDPAARFDASERERAPRVGARLRHGRIALSGRRSGGQRHGHSGKAADTRHLHRPTDFSGPIRRCRR